MPTLEPADLDFAHTAPRRIVVEQTIHASAAAVWKVVIDNPGWVDWFPTMTEAEDTSDPNTGVGSTRRVKVGGLVADERFIGWDPEKLWAFTIEKTNLPMAKRFLEQLEFDADGDTTTVRYTGAFEPLWFTKPIAGFVDKQIRTGWTDGLAGLAAQVSAASSAEE